MDVTQIIGSSNLEFQIASGDANFTELSIGDLVTVSGVGFDSANTGTFLVTGVSSDGTHPIQIAWKDLDAPQCGYCQSGMIMSTLALLTRNPAPTDADIDAAVTNACRCSSYHRVRKAIHRAVQLMKA